MRASQAVNTRAAVARRARVVRALPRVCWLASQLRRVRRSSSSSAAIPSRSACSSSAGEVAEVGAHGVGREVPLGDEVALVVAQDLRERLGQRVAAALSSTSVPMRRS